MSIDDAPACRGGWTAYVVGTAWALRQDGAPVRGLDVAVTSNIPMGAGLSSSAALTCATALAVTELNSITVDRMVLARAAQRAERDVVGAPVGLMDQVASLLGRKGAAVLVDCRTTALAYLPLPDGLALVVIDTKVRHSNASGGYESRRRECAQAARLLGVPALRDASLHDVDGLPEPLRRRARHVVTENSRVVDAVDALGRHRHDDLATLLSASHASLRDDFEVSVPELDLAVATATDTGAIGARMTGGGFGGAALALTPHDRVDAVTDAVMAAFSAAGFRRPSVLVVASADAADRVAD
jgi:galactokinase